MKTISYRINEFDQVFSLEEWENGSTIETYLGQRVRSRFVQAGANILRFENDDYVVKEFVGFVEGDDEEQTQFNQLVAARIEYWMTEGSA